MSPAVATICFLISAFVIVGCDQLQEPLSRRPWAGDYRRSVSCCDSTGATFANFFTSSSSLAM